MNKFILAIVFVFITACCGRANAADWTVEEQCQFYNKWTVTSDSVSGMLAGVDVSYLQHPPIILTDKFTGQKIVGGICPGDAIGNFGLYTYYRE